MRKKIIAALVAVAVGVVIFLIGLTFSNTYIIITGLFLYAFASYICGDLAGTTMDPGVEKQAANSSSLGDKAVVGCAGPLFGIFNVSIGWIFAIIKLTKLPHDN